MTRPHGDGLTDLGLILLATTAGLAVLLDLAGTLSASLARLSPPAGGPAAALGVLTDPAHPADALAAPGLPAWLYWTVLATLLGCTLAAVAAARAVLTRPSSPGRLPGTATRAEIGRAAGGRALRRRGPTLRPSLSRHAPTDVGYRIGTARGRQVWASVEDSMLILGPPRSGKGLHLVINLILDAPGAVITTSTRPDTLAVTYHARRAVGPVAVFDPQQLAPGLDVGLRWSLTRGCETPRTAMVRAAGLAMSTGLTGGGVDNGSFWEAKTRVALQCLLHAAALDGRDARHLYEWALNPARAVDAVAILHATADAADGWADALDGMVSADPRTRDSIWHGVALAVAALADPDVLAAITPTRHETFDPTRFLTDRSTLYLLATGTGAGAAAPLVAAFIEDLTETARRLAATAPAARLDPPVLMALDEIGNLAPLPSLPTLMADGGGTGIATVPVLQSLAQARSRWGDHAATAIWDAAIVKIVLGGGSNSRDLTDLSHLLGERDETTTSTTVDHTGARSRQHATRRIPVLPVDVIRTLPFGTALTVLRTARPVITTLRSWTARPDADHLTRQRDRTQQQLHAARRHQPDRRRRSDTVPADQEAR